MRDSDAGRGGPGRRLRRWLYIAHRWLGIATCLLFAMWFLSGLVMIYVPFPALTSDERLAALPPIDWTLVRRLPEPQRQGAPVAAPPRTLLLEMRGDLPVWRAVARDGAERDFSALDGGPLMPPSAGEAARIAARFGHAGIADLKLIERDQWTVAGSFDRHRPLWQADLAGPGGRVLYVSGRTGAVVLDTDASERFWNWLGSVPHWIYPTILRRDNAVWRQVVMWLSGPCIIAGVTGLWMGVLRWRPGRRRYRAGRITPYRGWMAWHHWAGLIGGLFLITWIFSGWLSVDPFRLFSGGGVSTAAQAAYERVGQLPRLDPRRLARVANGARQVELSWAGGTPVLEARWPDARRIFDGATLQRRVPAIDPRPLMPGSRIASSELLSAPDHYWYEAGARPLLPVLRVRFADPAATWAYIDPATGRVLLDLDARGRLYRWLFDLLHKWDLNLLTLHRPLWDLLLWLFSVAGIVTATSGIRIGWRRLRRVTAAG